MREGDLVVEVGPAEVKLATIRPSTRQLAIGGCILGNMVDGYGVVAVAFIGKAIETAWNLPPVTLGMVFSAGPAGMMLGSFLLSPFADRIGRRTIALTALAIVAAGMFSAAAAGTAAQLILVLLLTGFGIGGVLATLNTVVSELAEPARRNATMSLFAAGYPLGSTIAGGFAIGLMKSYGWPIVFLVGGGLASLAFLVNLFTLPAPITLARSATPGEPSMMANLFGPKVRATTIAISLAFFLNMLSFYFVLLWTARLTVAAGFDEAVGSAAMTIVNVGSLVGPLLFGLLADRIGLLRVACWYFVGMAIAIASFAAVTPDAWTIYACAGLVGVLVAGTMTSLYSTTPLLFAPQVRAAGTGLAIGIGRLGATLGPALAGIGLQLGVGRAGLYLVFAVPPLLVAMLIASGRIDPPASPARQENV